MFYGNMWHKLSSRRFTCREITYEFNLRLVAIIKLAKMLNFIIYGTVLVYGVKL